MQVGDHEVVAQFALNAVAASLDAADRMLTQAWDQKSRAHARTVCRLWAAKGYQVIYLSGRQVRQNCDSGLGCICFAWGVQITR